MAEADAAQPSVRSDSRMMDRALARAWHSRLIAPPNPWVGALLVTSDGTSFEGSTRRPGNNHAEVEVLRQAGERARGATMYVTLEPCAHHGRTPPCVQALVEAGVSRVVVGLVDPDPRVAGAGIAMLSQAGIDVAVGVGEADIRDQLAPYLKHRETGLPYVVLKLAATLDGRTAAADGSSQWITGDEARLDAHRLRAESGAIVVGAATVRDDNPRLTVRGVESGDGLEVAQPLRVVLGKADTEAAIHPCLEYSGDLGAMLADLGKRNVLQVMVEGGANVAGQFQRLGLVDRYVVYVAPALMGGSDGRPMLDGSGAASIDGILRGEYVGIRKVGMDLRLDLLPDPSSAES